MRKDKELFLANTDVSRETLERLEAYAACLERWTKKINLVSPSTVSDLWSRHFLDSAQLLEIAPVGFRSWVDLGSGGGFPGAVIAMLIAENDMTKVTLVESDQRKAAFLRAVCRESRSNFDVISQRAEDIDPLKADVLSARALAPLSKLLDFAQTHLAEGGRALFMKGKAVEVEMSEALEHWQFDCETYKSCTDAEAVILSIGEIKRV